MAHMFMPYAITEDGDTLSIDDMRLLNDNPTTAADIKLHTRLFKKALMNRDGIFGESSKTKTVQISEHNEPTANRQDYIDNHFSSIKRDVIREKAIPPAVVLCPIPSTSTTKLSNDNSEILISNGRETQILTSSLMPNPIRGMYDIILHQPNQVTTVLVRDVVSTAPTLPMTSAFPLMASILPVADQLATSDGETEDFEINVVD